MNVNDIRVGEVFYLLLSIPPHPLPPHHLVRFIHICMNLANSSLRMRRMPYTRACKRECASEMHVFGSTCEGRSAPCEFTSWNRINFWLVITASYLLRASSQESLTEFITLTFTSIISYAEKTSRIKNTLCHLSSVLLPLTTNINSIEY